MNKHLMILAKPVTMGTINSLEIKPIAIYVQVELNVQGKILLTWKTDIGDQILTLHL